MTERPTLDAALAAWATTEPAGAGDQAALARILDHAETIATHSTAPARRDADAGFRPKPGWMLGGALAASVAVALLLSPMGGDAPGPAPDEGDVLLASAGDVRGGTMRLAEADSDTRAAFALLYTPTVEEEYQL